MKSDKDLEIIFQSVVEDFKNPNYRGKNFVFVQSIPRICYTSLMPSLQDHEITDETRCAYMEWFINRAIEYEKELCL